MLVHRLFFALWPDDELRAQLVARTAHALTQQPRVMQPENLHVTLAFIGAVPAAQLQAVIAIGNSVVFTGGELVFEQLTIWQPAHVLVLKAVQVPQALQQLVSALQQRLTAAGFQLDQRQYQPHVTLARDVRVTASEKSSETTIEPLHWHARQFVLVESIRHEQGVRYQVLATYGNQCAQFLN